MKSILPNPSQDYSSPDEIGETVFRRLSDSFRKGIKKVVLPVLFLVLSNLGWAQNVVQSGFIGVTVPQYMATGGSTRLPIMWRATVTGLSPSTSYRYFCGGGISSDLGGTNPGAGNPVLINAAGTTYSYSSGASLTAAGNYETFTTDGSGNYTGWFGFQNTGNARFTAGNVIYPIIVIGSNTGTTLHRRALDQTILALGFATSAGANNGSFIKSTSSATGKNIAVLYSNAAGTGRPLNATVIENIGVTMGSSVIPGYLTTAGSWNAITPNNNANGVQRIEQRNVVTNALIGCATDSNGSWPTGPVNTANTTSGTTAIVISGTDAPLTSCGGTPLIAITGTLTTVNTTYGTASISPTSYSVSGSDLVANITLTPPSGFEISKTVGGGSGYATSQTLTQSGGSVPSTTIYLRLAATTLAGAYSGNITHVAGAASANIATAPSTVSAKALTASGASANNKIYDRTTAATISGATANGTVNGDAITISGGGTFADALVGSGKTVTPALTLSGTNASSYTLTQPSGLTADIIPKDLTVSGASVSNKVYDGNTSAVLSGTLSGVIAPDNVSLDIIADFDSPFVANGINITSSSVLSGADASNYNLIQPTGLSADITPKALTLAGAAAQNKVFDGNTDAVITGTLTGVISPDDVSFLGTGTFAQSAVGNGIAVTSTSTLTGFDAANYTLIQPTGLIANISSQALQPQTITFDPLADVIYGDSSFALTATASSGLTVSYSSSDTSVATIAGNTVTLIGAGTTTITASQQGDGTYDSAPTVDQPLTVNVKALTASATAENKVYDDNDAATISGTLVGVVGADVVTFIGIGNFATTDVANGIAVTSNSTLGGIDADNYTLTQPTGLSADITTLALSVSNAVAGNKVYDGNTNTTISGETLNGVVGADDVTVSGNGTFASEDVANGIAVTAALTLGGIDAANYTLIQPTGLTADITALALSITGLTGDNKIYDGNTAAAVGGSGVLNGVIGVDNVSVAGSPIATFNNKNVGIAKPIAVTGYTLNGADAGNYTVSQPTGITADITPASVTISGAVAQDKPFDGNTAATITGTLAGVIAPDVVSLIGTGTFSSSAVGNNIAVTSTSTLGGADGGNYNINPQPTGLTANIIPAPSVIANWTYQPLNGAITAPTANVGTGTSSLVGSMLVAAPGTATGMNTPTGCGGQTSGTLAWAITTAAPGATNESSGVQFNTSTSGYEDIRFTWEQRSSNTSANTMRLQYTLNGSTWTNFTMDASNTTFCLGSLNNGRFEANTTGDQFRRVSVNLSAIAGANDNPSFGVRVVAAHYQSTGQFRTTATPTTVATAGTWRFDNVKFEGLAIPATPPTASVISGDATICIGDSANINVAITAGTSPFSIVYTDGTSNFTVNNYTSGAAINVTPTVSTTYTIISVSDANNLVGTGNSGSANITVNQLYSFYADADGDTYGAGELQNGICAVNATTAPTGFSVNNTDCNDGIAAINPGAAEINYDGVDNNCNNILDEGFQLKTKLLPSVCGTTLASIGSLIGITTINSTITGYRIRVTNGAQVQVVERSVPHFTLPNLPSYEYATTYTVEIMLQRNGVWLGYYGDPCLVSSPAVLAEGGATQVSPSQCGIVLPRINTLIATTSLQGATGYRFKVTNITAGASGPNVIQTIDRVQHWFNLPMLTQYNYGSTYRIEVAVKTNGAYSGFGAPCEVSSPAAPSLTNCGGTIATTSTLIPANSVQGATQYRFQITRTSDNAQSTIDRNTNYFTFNMVPGFSAGVEYAIRVAVMTVGTWSPFGDACLITAPGAASRFIGETTSNTSPVTFKASAYPNPFSSAFAINLTSDKAEMVQLNVYDMTGRLIEVQNVNFSDLNAIQVGSSYPSGIYNVIVSQGENVESLRIIKR